MDSRSFFLRHHVAITAGAALMLLVGCGGDRGRASGRVEYNDGTPVAGATIVARSSTGANARGQADAEGQFSLGTVERGDGLPPGEYAVIILEELGNPERPRPRTIPEKYESLENSGITLSVKPGENVQLNITIQRLSERKQPKSS